MRQSESLSALITALVAAQKEMPGIEKDAQGHGYRYASLDNIMSKVRPVLTAHGLVIVQQPTGGDGPGIGLTTRLLHESGEWIEETVYAPRDEGKRRNSVQASGSTVTYLRRYGIAALLGLADETDTDASSTSSGPRTESASQPPQQNGRPQWDGNANAATNFWALAKRLKLSKEEGQEIVDSQGGNFRHAWDKLVAEHVPPEDEAA